MHSVFNSNFFKLFICLLLVSFQSYATECGKVRFSQNLKDKSLLRVIEVDNKKVVNKVNHLDDYSTHYLRTGNRVFHLVEESKELYSNKELAKLHRRKLPKFNSQRLMRIKKLKPYYDKQIHHYLSFNVEKDKEYLLTLNEQNKLMVHSSAEEICNAPTKIWGENKSVIEIGIEELPRELGLKLREYSIKKLIHPFHIGDEKQGQFNQVNLYNHFGLVLDNKYGRHGGLKILSSQPNSLAFNMGLRTNDEIVNVEGKDVIKSDIQPLKQFETLIKDINYYSVIDIQLLRDGSVESLSHKIKPIVIPTNWFGFENNDIISSTNTLQSRNVEDDLYYAAVMLPLSAYLGAQYTGIDQVKISAQLLPDPSLGISGEVLSRGGLIITKIEHQSPLRYSGLQAGDVLESVGKSFNETANTQNVKQYFSRLQPGEKYFLHVNRENKKMLLTGEYQARLLPAFTLNVDLESVELVKQKLIESRRVALLERDMSFNKRYWNFGRAMQGNITRHSKHNYPKNNDKQNKKGGS